MNINAELFRRLSPKKKLEIIENLKEDELLRTSKDTVIRIIKEVGSRRYKNTRDKVLWIPSKFRAGNNWNADVEGFDIIKGTLYIDLYVQYSNTDRTLCEHFDTFFMGSEYQGRITYEDRYGGKQTDYFTFDRSDRAKVLKSILLTYIHKKYADKLAA